MDKYLYVSYTEYFGINKQFWFHTTKSFVDFIDSSPKSFRSDIIDSISTKGFFIDSGPPWLTTRNLRKEYYIHFSDRWKFSSNIHHIIGECLKFERDNKIDTITNDR